MSLARLMASVALVGLIAQPALGQNQDQPQPQAPAAAGPEQPIPQEDMDFVMAAAGAGMAEINLGELAKERATNDEVKLFGQRMVDDHGQANEQLTSIAQQKGIDLPQEPPDEARQAMDELAQKSGTEFDQAFMDMMVADHQKAVDLFEQQTQSGQDLEIKAFAEATLPTLQEHLLAEPGRCGSRPAQLPALPAGLG